MAQFDNVKFELLGESEGVRDWQGLQIIATFDNDNNQPNITTSELTFSLDMGKKIIDHIDNGAGVFQGIDFEMFLNNPSTEVFKGILDLADDIEINREKKEVKAKLLKLDGLNTFANVSEAITMGLLESEGVFTSADYVDIPYIKETEFDYLATAILIVSIFQIQKQLQDLIILRTPLIMVYLQQRLIWKLAKLLKLQKLINQQKQECFFMNCTWNIPEINKYFLNRMRPFLIDINSKKQNN